MVNIIKEETIEDSVKVLLSDILEYDNVVNEFLLPVLKSKLDNPKQEFEKELKNLNTKKDRIRKAYILIQYLQKKNIKVNCN